MRLPFTIDQFLGVFRGYNEAVWPVQWVLAAVGVIAVVSALRGEPRTSRLVSVLLAVLWFWMAIAYHLAFFADLSRVGIVFGLAFGLQGALWSWLAVRKQVTVYRPASVATMSIGAVLILYALIFYPVLGFLLGHRYPASPTFGVPCPTTIFTLGLMAWAGSSMPHRLLLVPLAWAVVGTSAAANLGMTEDFGLLGAALLTAGVLVGARRRVPLSGRRAPARTRSTEATSEEYRPGSRVFADSRTGQPAALWMPTGGFHVETERHHDRQRRHARSELDHP